MKIIGRLKNIKSESFWILILFILASIEPPFLLPFSFPKTTWGIMKLGLLIFILIELGKLWVHNNKDYFQRRKQVFFPILFYLLACLISFGFSVDINASLEFFLFLGIGLSFFFLALRYFQEIKVINKYLWSIIFLSLFSGIFGIVIISLFRYGNFVFLNQFFNKLFPWDGFGRFLGDLERGRVQTFWHLEFGFPILAYFYFFSKKNQILTLSVFILSFIGIMLANNRYQFVTMVFGLCFFIFVNKKSLFLKNKKQLLSLVKIIFVLAISGILLSNFLLKKNLFERFLLRNYSRDVKTLQSRVNLFGQAGKLFLSSPIFGIGPKNFSFYMSPETERKDDPLWRLYRVESYSHVEPHNLFFQTIAELGAFGLLAVLFLYGSFLLQDFYLLKITKDFNQRAIYSALIFASWSYFVDEQFTFINDSLPAVVFFWFTRGVLAAIFLKMKVEKKDKSPKEKIMFVAEKWVEFGGVEKEILNVSREFQKFHPVFVYVLPQKKRWRPVIFLSLWFNFLKFRPTVVFSYGEYSNLITAICLLFYPLAVKWFACEMNNPYRMFVNQKYKYCKKKAISFFYNNSAKSIIAISQKVKQILADYFGVNKNKIQVINSAVPLEQISLLAENDKKLTVSLSKTNYVVAVGRLSFEKRLSYLIEVFKKISLKNKELKLLIIGEGEERGKLRSLIDKLSLTSRVFLVGGKENPYPYIKNAKLLSVTSSSEGFPHVIIEAMALGVLVVSTDYDGVEEIIEHEKNGIIVGMENQDEMASQILKLYQDKNFRQKLISKAKEKVVNCDQGLILKKYRCLLET